MQNLLTSQQVRDADANTIAGKPISPINLMEAASLAFVNEFKKEAADRNVPVSIFCGTGNNGGDGLAVARLLKEEGYGSIEVRIVRFSGRSTEDFDINLRRLKETGIPVTDPAEAEPIPQGQPGIIIDALLGSGLSRPAEGLLERIIHYINESGKKVVSIDVPSGFPSEGIIDPGLTIIKAVLAISFQRPKINFFFPESASVLERFITVPIGLNEEHIQSLPCAWKLIGDNDIAEILKPRKPFTHKGTYGHALIVAGNTKTMGAALLCADACLHSGTGLTTACIPGSGLVALNTRSPEIMALARDEVCLKEHIQKYSSIAIGPGLGTEKESTDLLREVLACAGTPLVLDADALTILAKTPELFGQVPTMSILTPHMKEFDRMFGDHGTWWERIVTARKKAAGSGVIILLKNQYSFIVLPDGNVLINPTGNPAMATGGMGDVLTGMIASLLAQGHTPTEAVITACYLHGKAGDELRNEGMNSIPPRYLIEKLPFVINKYSP